MTASPSQSNQIENFDEIIEGAKKCALMEVNPDKDGFQRLRARRGEFQDWFVAGIARFTAKLPDYTTAKSILGGDFITPGEIATKRPDLACTDEQIAELADSIPSIEDLQWCKANGFAVVAGSPRPMSLLDIRSSKPNHFYSKTEGWYANADQKFSRDDKVSLGWLMIRKKPVPKSTNKTWDEQNQLLSNTEQVPNDAEMSWFITIFFEVRGVRLFKDVYVRTSSVSADGDRVYVGIFGDAGLSVSTDWDSARDDRLGVASSRKS
jgi:hypothetical protein